MFRYADPAVCPACRTRMAPNAPQCPSCHTTLSGSVAQDLFQTLTRADGLVAELLRLSAHSTAARTAPVPATAAGPAAGPVPSTEIPSTPTAQAPIWSPAPSTAGMAPYPAPTVPPAPRKQMAAASGAKILLGLGALCLLVAAAVFIAVAWSQLGVAGRTAILLALTLGAAGAATMMARNGLRGGAEALTTVALGFLVVDIFGADSSGWLPEMESGAFLLLLGAALGSVATIAAALALGSKVTRLASAELIAALGALLALVGLAMVIDGAAGLAVTLVLALALTALMRLMGLTLAAVPMAALSVLWWGSLVVSGFARIDDTSYAGFFSHLQVWPLVFAAAVAGAVASFRKLPLPVRVAVGGLAVGLLGFVAAGPVFDEAGLVVAVVALLFLVLAAGWVLLREDAWAWLVSLPVVVAGIVLAGHGASRAGHALDAHFNHGAWTGGAGADLTPYDYSWQYPLALPVAAVGALLGLWIAARLVAPQVNQQLDTRRWVLPAGVLVAGTLALLPGAYGAPAAVALVVLLAFAVLSGVLALRSRDLVTVWIASGAALVAVGMALGAASISAVLTAVTSALLVLAAVALAVVGRAVVRGIGDVALAPAVALLVWTTGHLLDVDPSWRGVVVLGLLGTWAITRARLTREVPVLVTGVVSSTLAIGLGDGSAASWTAIHLTVAGVLVAITSVVNPARRWAAWGALVLLTWAQWIRLGQLGVDTVEAYTLPLAVVLLVVGVVAMRRRPRLGSVPALTTGLVLALTPSLLVALGDPVSWRALALGIACALVVLTGAALRWSAPILVGGIVGAVLVIRELAHSGVIPQWLVIGLVGLTLVIVGATWERSLAEVKEAAGKLKRLR